MAKLKLAWDVTKFFFLQKEQKMWIITKRRLTRKIVWIWNKKIFSSNQREESTVTLVFPTTTILRHSTILSVDFKPVLWRRWGASILTTVEAFLIAVVTCISCWATLCKLENAVIELVSTGLPKIISYTHTHNGWVGVLLVMFTSCGRRNFKKMQNQ